MKFDAPATTNPIDQLKVVGKPIDRIDGPLKTTGTAAYAYEHDGMPNVAYGYVVGAGIAKGRIASIDAREAKSAPGVLTVITALDIKPLAKSSRNTAQLFGGAEIHHYHQAIALVVANTFEQARAAASKIRVNYSETQGAFDLTAAKNGARKPEKVIGGPPDSSVGDFASAFAAAPVKFDATYATPDQSHAMMEPHASIAEWNGDKLTLWTSNQMIDWCTTDLAKTLGIPKEDIRVMSPFIGGGFGGKLFVRADAALAALGARAVRKPVKVALTRPLMFNNTTHRPATIQRIRIGAMNDGKITAIAHECWSGDLPGGKPDGAVHQTRLLYAGENRLTATRLATLDLAEANAMRAPGEATGMMALEVAMDEMAEKLGLDPIEFRIRNDTQIVPDDPKQVSAGDTQAHKGNNEKSAGRPFSQRQLVQCLRTGAERFAWNKRNAKPGKTRDGDWLIGIGMAAAFRGNQVVKSGARVRLDKRGMLTVETDMTDIGTGSYTIIAQTAAEMFGLPLDKVIVRLGDSKFPVSAGSGGQWGGNCSTAGVYAACMKLREDIAQKLGINSADAIFADGRVTVVNQKNSSANRKDSLANQKDSLANRKDSSASQGVSLAEIARDGELIAEDAIEFGDFAKQYEQSTFGAHFAEVGVDIATGEIRVRRMLTVCASGRILNPKAARSQVIGAMTMGVGAALMEELVVDKRRGFFVNHDLAQYEVPVHADIPHQDVIFLDEVDPISSPMKAKGVAELGICGVAAAVANAVYNATGIRVRDYPITLDKLLDKLPAVI